MSQEYNIDRQTASRILNVSLRTIDRYLENGKLDFVKNQGRVWLSKNQILKLRNSLMPKPIFENVEIFEKESEAKVVEQDQNDLPVAEKNSFYKSLYEEVKLKLESARNRIFELENQVKSMVPLMEFQKQQHLLQSSSEEYEHKLKEIEQNKKLEAEKLLNSIYEREKLLKEKDKEINSERFNKAIFAVIVFVLLFLQILFWLLVK